MDNVQLYDASGIMRSLYYSPSDEATPPPQPVAATPQFVRGMPVVVGYPVPATQAPGLAPLAPHTALNIAPQPAAFAVAPPAALVPVPRRSRCGPILGAAIGLACAAALCGGIAMLVLSRQRGELARENLLQQFCTEYPWSYVGSLQDCIRYWGDQASGSFRVQQVCDASDPSLCATFDPSEYDPYANLRYGGGALAFFGALLLLASSRSGV